MDRTDYITPEMLAVDLTLQQLICTSDSMGAQNESFQEEIFDWEES